MQSLHKPHSCVGLLLAAGYGRRYGSDKRKACLPAGTPLLLASLRAAEAVMDEVWVVLRPEDDLEDLALAGHTRIVRCEHAHHGMGSSLACGVQAISQASDARALMLLLGDMPWIRPGTLETLLGRAAEDSIVVPLAAGRRGHPVIFGRRFWPELMALEGDQGARSVLARYREAMIPVDTQDPGVLLDVDTPDALVTGVKSPH
ncbi:MAG: nucleotidyltransferase family protein [Pseudomonadaceae bacterium]